MTATVFRANAATLPLADDSVDLVVTSPPYFALRSYQDGGEHYPGQLGSEPTPTEFVDALLAVTRECMRVLKPSGSLWVNLGDKYAGSRSGPQGVTGQRSDRAQAVTYAINRQTFETEVPNKSLMGIPWRYALRCIDDLGLILRAEVIWAKPNGLPESVTDRVRRSHEQWFHMVKQPRYYSAVDEIREPHAPWTLKAYAYEQANDYRRKQNRDRVDGGNAKDYAVANPLGKLPGSVWTINEGETLVRSVLNAVAAQALTADEGERILLWTASGSGVLRPSASTGAGNGKAHSRQTATGDTTPSTKGQVQRIGSPTDSPSDPSPTDSPSTTPAATGRASTPPTSSPSPSRSTSPDDPGSTSALTDTTTTSATPTSAPMASESAEGAWRIDRDGREQPSGPPSVWVVPTQPLTVPAHLGVDHFAAFPMEWPRRIIQGWSPPGICTACGEARRPTTERKPMEWRPGPKAGGYELDGTTHKVVSGTMLSAAETTITGYACACPDTTAPTRPSVVLDPFGGTGTTALVAHALGRHGISIDLSADYCRLAAWRTTDEGEYARALQVDKPAPQVDGQGSLLDLLEEAT